MSTSPQLQRAQDLFQHGNEAALKNNFDYAIQMYRDACKLAPDNLLFRQAMRGVQRRKYGNEPGKVGRLSGMRVQPIRIKIKTAKAKGNWTAVLEACDEAFHHNPWDVSVSVDFAEAAEQLGAIDLAQWALESVQVQAGDDADFWRHLARVYERKQAYQKAIHCWERVKKIDPSDETANRQMNALSANASIARSGLHDAIQRAEAHNARSATGSGTGPESDSSDEIDEARQPNLTPEQRWQKEIQEHPERIGPHLELADLYRHQGKLDDAEKVLSRALKAVPGDSVLQSAHAEVQVARLNKAIEGWTKRAKDNPHDVAAHEKIKQLNTMLSDYEIKEYRRRLTLRPDDMNLHLQLGMRLAKAGRHDAAIAEFQQARSSPELKVQSLLQTGLSFEANGVLKLAERSYQDAIKAADPDDLTTLNALHYRLGRAAEALGKLKEAEEHYHEVAANDFAYLDVAQRLRNLGQNA